MITQHEKGVIISIYAKPGASRSQLRGLHGDRIAVSIAAPAVDGAANKELLKFLSKLIGTPKSNIELLREQTGKQKDLLIHGGNVSELQKIFTPDE